MTRSVDRTALLAVVVLPLLGLACAKGAQNSASQARDTAQAAQGAPGGGAQTAPQSGLANPVNGVNGDTAATQTVRHRSRAEASGHHGAGRATTAGADAAPATPPAPPTGVIPAGSTMELASSGRVCTNTKHVGDGFTAALTTAMPGSNGVALPAGTLVTFRVTEAKASDNVTQHGQIGVAADSLAVNGVSYPVDASITSVATEKVRATSTGQQVTKVGVGAAAGAILGRIIGHNAKSTIIGAAAGAAAGGGAAVATTKYDFCIPQGGKIELKLTSDQTI